MYIVKKNNFFIVLLIKHTFPWQIAKSTETRKNFTFECIDLSFYTTYCTRVYKVFENLKLKNSPFRYRYLIVNCTTRNSKVSTEYLYTRMAKVSQKLVLSVVLYID